MPHFRVLKTLLSLSLILSSISAFAGPVVPLWSDLKDIAQYRPREMPDAKVILRAIRSEPDQFIPDASSDGAKIIGSIAVQKQPEIDGSERTYGDVIALMHSSKGNFFRRYSIEIQDADSGARVEDVAILEDVPVSELRIEATTGLIQRLVLVEDPTHDITLIYPLGVGGVDPGVITRGSTRLMTPLFRNATLRRATVMNKRFSPTYYRGYPFMPITTSRGNRTAIAFHVTILSDRDWRIKGPNYLVRGFESHGCMRLRAKDLMEYHLLVMEGAREEVPVNVDYFIFKHGENPESPRSIQNGMMAEDHPYPLSDGDYQRVKNVAEPGEPPRAGRDPLEHLTIMEGARGRPNLTHLASFTAEDLVDLGIYERDGIGEADARP